LTATAKAAINRAMDKAPAIYVDADSCPVKAEVYRVAERHAMPVVVVANSYINVPRVPGIRLQVVGSRLDEADDWIAEHAGQGDIVVTNDIPLADRALKAQAVAIAPNGKPFTVDSIGMALATRAIMQDLRAGGEQLGGPKPFAAADRSRFLQALHEAIVRLRRQG
jgi:uncharacterized protein YaiI (UPF0178 family)